MEQQPCVSDGRCAWCSKEQTRRHQQSSWSSLSLTLLPTLFPNPRPAYQSQPQASPDSETTAFCRLRPRLTFVFHRCSRMCLLPALPGKVLFSACTNASGGPVGGLVADLTVILNCSFEPFLLSFSQLCEVVLKYISYANSHSGSAFLIQPRSGKSQMK